MITIFYKIRVFEFIIFRPMFTVAFCTKALVWCGWMGKIKLPSTVRLCSKPIGVKTQKEKRVWPGHVPSWVLRSGCACVRNLLVSKLKQKKESNLAMCPHKFAFDGSCQHVGHLYMYHNLLHTENNLFIICAKVAKDG